MTNQNPPQVTESLQETSRSSVLDPLPTSLWSFIRAQLEGSSSEAQFDSHFEDGAMDDRRTLVQAFLRELLQNILDEKLTDGPARARIFYS